MMMKMPDSSVAPVQTGAQGGCGDPTPHLPWIPDFSGMTGPATLETGIFIAMGEQGAIP